MGLGHSGRIGDSPALSNEDSYCVVGWGENSFEKPFVRLVE